VVALANLKRVKSITVVEKAPEVAELVWDATMARVRESNASFRLWTGDLFHYLKHTEQKYDCGFYDIWQSDGEATFHETVLPLRKLSVDIVDRVACWNEDIMRAQLRMSLWSRYAAISGLPRPRMEDVIKVQRQRKGSVFHDWSIGFWDWLAQRPMSPYHVVVDEIDAFVNSYGLVHAGVKG
jgi:hypothetical protein